MKTKDIIVATMCFLAFAVPCLSYSRIAPYHSTFGDVYRGWPLVYGLDQGDVYGEFLFLLAHFNLAAFLIDIIVALSCGMLLLGVIFVARRFITNNGHQP
jgi:hypothetical protein